MGIGCPEYVLLFCQGYLRYLPRLCRPAYHEGQERILAGPLADRCPCKLEVFRQFIVVMQRLKGAGIDKDSAFVRNYRRERLYNYEEHVSFAEER